MTDWWKKRTVRDVYKFVRVSRATGEELEMLPMLRGGTVTRNNDVRILDTAEVTCVGKFDIGADLVRIYRTAEWMGGHTETVVLGTFIPMVPSRNVHNRFSTATVKLYGRLQELLQDKFATPYTIAKGENAVEVAKRVAAEIGLNVIAEQSDYTVTRPRVYGIGADQNNSETDDTKLGMVNDLLSLAGFRAAKSDVMGNILYSKYVDPEKRPAAYSMSEGPDCKFEPDMTDERDITETANHVVVIYKGENSGGTQTTYVGEAWDNNPDSPYSTVSRGYTITKGYEYSDIPSSIAPDPNMLSGSESAKMGSGTKESGTFRTSDNHGTVSTVYVPDSPQIGISYGFKISSNGGCIGFCQDAGPTIKAGTTVTQSIWVKGTAGKNIQIQIFWDQNIGAGSGRYTVAMTGKWQKISTTFTPAADHLGSVSWGYVYLEAGGEATVVANKVEEGKYVSAWPQDSIQAYADKRAKTLLGTNQSGIRHITMHSTYYPATVNDSLNIEYPTGDINGKFEIRVQKLTLTGGCPVETELRQFTR